MAKRKYTYEPKCVDEIIIRPFAFEFPDDLDPIWVPDNPFPLRPQCTTAGNDMIVVVGATPCGCPAGGRGVRGGMVPGGGRLFSGRLFSGRTEEGRAGTGACPYRGRGWLNAENAVDYAPDCE